MTTRTKPNAAQLWLQANQTAVASLPREETALDEALGLPGAEAAFRRTGRLALFLDPGKEREKLRNTACAVIPGEARGSTRRWADEYAVAAVKLELAAVCRGEHPLDGKVDEDCLRAFSDAARELREFCMRAARAENAPDGARPPKETAAQEWLKRHMSGQSRADLELYLALGHPGLLLRWFDNKDYDCLVMPGRAELD